MKADLQTSGEFWPEGVRGYLSQLIREEYPHYPVYFGNTPCSIAHVRGLSDLCGHYNEPVCTESNCLQRDRCARAYRVPTDSDIGTAAHAIGVEPERIVIRDGTAVLQGALASEKITYLRFALRFPVVTDTIDYSAGYNWPNVRQEARIVEVPWKQNWT